MIRRAGIFYNPKVPQASNLARDIELWLAERGVEVWSGDTGARETLESVVGSLGLLMVLGGDGTTLLGARIAAPYEVPVYGVNLGRVGFLSEATVDNWPKMLAKVIRGEFWTEKRLMLNGTVSRGGNDIAELSALNDIVVSRGAIVRVVRFHLYVDGERVITYTADGLIAATPTGSTAYSMAAGGPLLPPSLPNFLLLPVAPHLSFERPIVFHQEAQVKIQVEMDYDANATADGQDSVPLQSGDEVTIKKHSCDSHFARVEEPNYFYHRLMQHLSFWSRRR